MNATEKILCTVLTMWILLPQSLLAHTDLDLSSVDRRTTADHHEGFQSATMQVGATVRNVTPGTLLTDAEHVALHQILQNGHQHLELGAMGNAVGGHFDLSAEMAGSIHNLVVPEGVTAVHDFGVKSVLSLTGNLTNAGNVFAISSNPEAAAAMINAANILNQQGALLSSVLPSGALASYRTAVRQLDLNLAAQNVINSGTISSSGNLRVTATESIVNALPSGMTGATPVLQALNNLNVQAPHIVNQGQLLAQLGGIDATTAQLTNTGTIQSLVSYLNVHNITGNTLLVNSYSGSLLARDHVSFKTLESISNVEGGILSKAVLSVTGGIISANSVNFESQDGKVEVYAQRIDGAINVKAGTAAIGTKEGDLRLSSLLLTGDPIFFSHGILDLSGIFQGGLLRTGNQNFVALAGGSIVHNQSGRMFLDAGQGQVVIQSGIDFFVDPACLTCYVVHGPSGQSAGVFLPEFNIMARDIQVSSANGPVIVGHLLAGNVDIYSPNSSVDTGDIGVAPDLFGWPGLPMININAGSCVTTGLLIGPDGMALEYEQVAVFPEGPGITVTNWQDVRVRSVAGNIDINGANYYAGGTCAQTPSYGVVSQGADNDHAQSVYAAPVDQTTQSIHPVAAVDVSVVPGIVIDDTASGDSLPAVTEQEIACAEAMPSDLPLLGDAASQANTELPSALQQQSSATPIAPVDNVPPAITAPYLVPYSANQSTVGYANTVSIVVTHDTGSSVSGTVGSAADGMSGHVVYANGSFVEWTKVSSTEGLFTHHGIDGSVTTGTFTVNGSTGYFLTESGHTGTFELGGILATGPTMPSYDPGSPPVSQPMTNLPAAPAAPPSIPVPYPPSPPAAQFFESPSQDSQPTPLGIAENGTTPLAPAPALQPFSQNSISALEIYDQHAGMDDPRTGTIQSVASNDVSSLAHAGDSSHAEHYSERTEDGPNVAVPSESHNAPAIHYFPLILPFLSSPQPALHQQQNAPQSLESAVQKNEQRLKTVKEKRQTIWKTGPQDLPEWLESSVRADLLKSLEDLAEAFVDKQEHGKAADVYEKIISLKRGEGLVAEADDLQNWARAAIGAGQLPMRGGDIIRALENVLYNQRRYQHQLSGKVTEPRASDDAKNAEALELLAQAKREAYWGNLHEFDRELPQLMLSQPYQQRFVVPIEQQLAKLYERSLAIKTGKGLSARSTAVTRSKLAGSLTALGQFEQAAKSYEKAIAELKSTNQKDDRELQKVQDDYAKMQAVQRRSLAGDSAKLAKELLQRKDVSDKFANLVELELSKIPAPILKKLKDQGIKVVAAKTLIHAEPSLEKEAVTPSPGETRPGWHVVGGVYSPPRVLIGEQVFDVKSNKWKTRETDHYRYVVRHEVGHAVGALLDNGGKQLDRTEAFIKAYLRDRDNFEQQIKKLPTKEKEKWQKHFNYFLTPFPRGTEEAFADVFAALTEEPEGKWGRGEWKKFFPNLMHAVKELVEK